MKRSALFVLSFVSIATVPFQGVFAEPTSPDSHSSTAQAGLALSLEDFINLVAGKNEKISYQHLEWKIASEAQRGEEALYEPTLKASYQHTVSNTPNTTEEEYRRTFSPEFDERNNDYTLGVERKTPIGGTVKLDYTLRQLANNIQPTPLQGKENKSFIGVTYQQPLLKGFGQDVTEAGMNIARYDTEVARQTFRETSLKVVTDAIYAYWDLYLAQQRYQIRKDSVAIAQRVLSDEQVQARLGKIAETEVLIAQAGVAQRQSQSIEAQQQLVAARNELRRYISALPNAGSVELSVTTAPDTDVTVPSFDEANATAHTYRPEFLASKKRAEQQNIRATVAENNKRPELNLSVSYGLNGLDKDVSSSWSNVWGGKHETWYVGVDYKMPIGNEKAKSDLATAEHRRQQAELEMRNAEIAIQNSIDTAVRSLSAAKAQYQQTGIVVDNNERLLQVELARFKSGQSNTRQLLDREENRNRAKELRLQAEVNLEKAVFSLKNAQGTLLRDFGIED